MYSPEKCALLKLKYSHITYIIIIYIFNGLIIYLFTVFKIEIVNHRIGLGNLYIVNTAKLFRDTYRFKNPIIIKDIFLFQ